MKTFEDYRITIEQQEILSEQYRQTNYAYINAHRRIDDPDSLTYTYDLDILLQYLNYVQRESQRLGKDKVKIRINLGKYPENNFDSRLNPDFLNHQTIFLNAVNEENQREEIITEIDAMDFAELCPPRCR